MYPIKRFLPKKSDRSKKINIMIDITKKIDKMIVINNQGNITITMDSLMDNLL